MPLLDRGQECLINLISKQYFTYTNHNLIDFLSMWTENYDYISSIMDSIVIDINHMKCACLFLPPKSVSVQTENGQLPKLETGILRGEVE